MRILVNSLTAPAGTSFYPNQPFSLLAQIDTGSGIKTLTPEPAEVFDPALPKALAPFSTWKGTFAGSSQVKSKSLFYVGFGQFGYDDPLSHPFSTSTAKSANSP